MRLGRGVTTADLLPRRGGIVKVSKRLGELKGFVDDPLLFVVVSDLGVTLWGKCQRSVEQIKAKENCTHGKRKIFPQREALESIVGQDTSPDSG